MIESQRVLAIIPARGGSKRLPGKNLKELAGKPLIAWSIEVAQACQAIDRIVVSSEDPAILDVARAYGDELAFERPAELAQDDTPSMAVVLHVLAAFPAYDYIVLLQPTSPLRTSADITQALELCMQRGANTCVSVSPEHRSPTWYFSLAGERLAPLVPDPGGHIAAAQQAGNVYVLNGAVYVARHDWLLQNGHFLNSETLGSVMPSERSVDIDTALEFAFAEYLLRNAAP